MRDDAVDTVVFIDADNRAITLKDKREYEPMTPQMKYKTKKGEELDLIAVNVYGEENEFNSYKIFDHNVEKIVDSGFDLDSIKELEIPN